MSTETPSLGRFTCKFYADMVGLESVTGQASGGEKDAALPAIYLGRPQGCRVIRCSDMEGFYFLTWNDERNEWVEGIKTPWPEGLQA
jgi:hypothetical protein